MTIILTLAIGLMVGIGTAPVQQGTSNIAKTDSDAKLSAARRLQRAVFEETETILGLGPTSQVKWARPLIDNSIVVQ